MAQEQPICHRCDAKKLLRCDATLGFPCRNCRNAVSATTRQRPGCQLKGPGRTARTSRPEPARASAPSASTLFAALQAGDIHRHQPPTAQAAAPSNAMAAALLTAPRAQTSARDPLATRAEDAERERRRDRADARNVRELQDQLEYVKDRVALEERARSAAEKRAEGNYRQGYQDGYQDGLRAAKAEQLARPTNDVDGIESHVSSPASKTVGAISAPRTGTKRTLSESLGDDQALAPRILRAATVQPQSSTLALTGPTVDKMANRSRLKELRERAMESVATFRDRQAAAKWMADNAGILRPARDLNGDATTGENAPKEGGDVETEEGE